MSLQLKPSVGGDFAPHPEGVFSAVCVDVMDLGLLETTWEGQVRMLPKVKLVFETAEVQANGEPYFVAQSFTASLHAKAKLNHFLGKWRGKPLGDTEEIDLTKLVGANCTIVLSHNTAASGKVYASIDAVSKPTARVTPSGRYDGEAARTRFAEWRAKQSFCVAEGLPMRQQARPLPPVPQARPMAPLQPMQQMQQAQPMQQARPVSHIPVGVIGGGMDFNTALAATRANPTPLPAARVSAGAEQASAAIEAMDDDIPF